MRFRLAALLAALLLIAAPALDLLTFHDPQAPTHVPLRPPEIGEIPWDYASRIDLSRIGEVMLGEAGWLVSEAGAQGIGGGIFGTPRMAGLITVSASGGQTTRICALLPGAGGANSCGDATDVCAAGSAVALAALRSPSATNPIVIQVGPGFYNECVHFDNIGHVSLVGAGIDATIIRPTVTTATSTQNGVLRFGATTVTEFNTHDIWVSHLTAHNDASSAPEAGIQVGKDAGPAAEIVSPWTRIGFSYIKAIGNHDAFQFFGCDDELSRVPVLILTDSFAIGGADTIVAKGASDYLINNVIAYSWSNYCESTNTTLLNTVTGTVAAGGSPTTFQVEAADDFGTNDGYNLRKVTFAGGACAAGHQGWINDYVTATDVATFSPAAAFSPDGTCTYTIAAVANYATGTTLPPSPCTDVDWNVFRNYWKHTVFHTGAFSGAIANPSMRGHIRGLRGTVQMNDGGSRETLSGCAGQPYVAGALLYSSSLENQLFIEDSSFVINIPIDLNDGIVCPDPIGGIVSNDDGGAVQFRLSGVSMTINNSGDPDENVRGIIADASVATTVRVDDAYVEINNTVGGYAGTSTTLFQGNSGTLQVIGDLKSDKVVTTEGAIVGWSERCFSLPDAADNWIATTDNQPIPISDANVGIQVAYVGCRCVGSCGASNGSLDFTDDAGNAFATAVACVEPTGDMTWTDVRADVDALLPAAKSPQYDTNAAPTTATDDLQVCLRYSTTRFAP